MGESHISSEWVQRLSVVALFFGALTLLAALPADADVTQSGYETCLLQKINADRADVGAPPLEMAHDKVQLVRDWSEWMRFNDFRHMESWERAPILPPGTSTWGENIAYHSAKPVSDCSLIHNMLMASDGHRANILRSSFRFVALGAYTDSSGWWVTEVFFDASGYPAAPPPDPCEPGSDCDTVALQDLGGRFNIWSELAYPGSGEPFYYGNPGDIAFTGDWDCDGDQTLGLYRQSDGYVYLRNSNSQGFADISFYFGIPGDFPLAGDFNGDGCDTVSIYRPSEARFYIINELGSGDSGLGAADYHFDFGVVGDKPFAGDFDGDGLDTVGLHRESTGLVYFRNSNTTGVAEFEFIYGIPDDVLIAGDWDGDGNDTIAVFRPSTGMIYLRNSNTAGVADAQVFAGTYAGISEINP